MDIRLPYSRAGMMLHLDESLDYEILESAIQSLSVPTTQGRCRAGISFRLC